MTVTLDTTSLYSGKGFDVQTLVNEVLASERGEETQWKSEQSTLQSRVSALDSFKTQIATLYADANNLRDLDGVFQSKTASSSDTGVLIATADSSASTADYTLRVQSLASTGVSYTAPVADGTALQAGTLTLTVGDQTKTVDVGTTNTSLSEIAAAVNQLNMGVKASVQSDSTGSRLAIVSDTAGTAGSISVTSDSSQLSFTNVAGQDSLVYVNGVPYQGTTNTLSDAITGVTLNLASAAPNTDVTLKVAPDASSVAAAISTFVTDYNAIVTSVNAQSTYDPTTKTAGVLSGDSSLNLLQQQLFSLTSFSMAGNGSLDSLRALGVTMNDDGTLQADSSQLNDALTNNFAALANFFTGTGSFGEQLGSITTSLNDPTNGAVSLDLQSLQQSNDALTNTINDFEARLSDREQVLLTQYSQINAQLQSLPSLQSQVSAELDSLSGFYSSSSKS